MNCDLAHGQEGRRDQENLDETRTIGLRSRLRGGLCVCRSGIGLSSVPVIVACDSSAAIDGPFSKTAR